MLGLGDLGLWSSVEFLGKLCEISRDNAETKVNCTIFNISSLYFRFGKKGKRK